MIRPFQRMDPRRLKANEFSKVDDMAWVFSDPDFYKNTLVDANDDVQCIVCFKPYWKDNYFAFFLMSDNMTPILARELKKFIDDAMIDLNARRVQTDSVHCEFLNRWHRFLGFELEGVRKQMIFGKDYAMWAKVR